MVDTNFQYCLSKLLVHEGGYSNHPSDPGGPTKYGITIHDYRLYINAKGTAADVQKMTVDQAAIIYRKQYWNKLRCGELPSGVDYAIFDYGVNSGVGRAARVLNRLVGTGADTAIRPATIVATMRRNPGELVTAICDERMRFLRALRTWPVFGRGWARRVAEVRAAAHALVGRPATAQFNPTPVPSVGSGPSKAVVPSPKTAKTAAQAGNGLLSGGLITYFYDNPWIIFAIIVGAIILGVVVNVIVTAWRKSKQYEVYTDGTPVPLAR